MPLWATTILGLALVAIVICVWFIARRRGGDAFGTPVLGTLGALLTFSPLFSLQYVSWLLPWAAIAHADGDRRAIPLTATVVLCTAILSALYGTRLPDVTIAVLIVRAVSVAGLVVPALRLKSSPRVLIENAEPPTDHGMR